MKACTTQASWLQLFSLVASVLRTAHALHYESDRVLLRTQSGTSLLTSGAASSADSTEARIEGQYLIDNSKLRSPSAGITYRRSKQISDLDSEHYELYGTIISGVNEHDDWLRVGANMFLPMKINGTSIMVLQGSSMSPARGRRGEEATYLVDNSVLKSTKAGLTYRLSKDLADTEVDHYAAYGSLVKGVDEGDGWLKVGKRFLPQTLAGKQVLLLQEEGLPLRAEQAAAAIAEWWPKASWSWWSMVAVIVVCSSLVLLAASLTADSVQTPSNGKSQPDARRSSSEGSAAKPQDSSALRTPPGKAKAGATQVFLSPRPLASSSSSDSVKTTTSAGNSSSIEAEYDIDFVHLPSKKALSKTFDDCSPCQENNVTKGRPFSRSSSTSCTTSTSCESLVVSSGPSSGETTPRAAA